MDKYLSFEIDKVEIIEGGKALFGKEEEDSQFATARIQAFASGQNLHDLTCSEETLKATAPTIFYKPLIYFIDEKRGDFGSHTTPDKSRPAGFVLPDSAEFIRLGDGRLSLNVTVKIWKKYAPSAMKIFQRSGGKKSVSVEMELFDYELDEDGQISEMKDFSYLGVCILGDSIREASPGANIQLLSFSEEMKNFESAILLEFSSRYDEIDFTIPEDVKGNAQSGLDLHSQYGGASNRDLAVARHIIKEDKVAPAKVRDMASVFRKKEELFQNMESDPPSESYIIYLLYGGEVGRDWVLPIYNQMKDLDDHALSYFEKITFPYDNVSEANPALKGIEPALTLSQMNMIARIADALIEDGMEKGKAWATAISQFKESHKVEDGRWVKKDDMSEENGLDETSDANKKKEARKMEEDKLNNSEEESLDESEEESTENEDFSEEENPDESEEEFEDESEDEDDEEEGEEESEDESDDESEDEEEFEFSIDVEKVRESLSDIEEVQEDLVSESPIDFSNVVDKLVAKIKAMSSEMEELKSENSKLNEFKETIMQKDFEVAVDATLIDINGRVEIDEDTLGRMKTESLEYSLENIDEWKNKVKAEALDFAPKKADDEQEQEPFITYANPWANIDPDNKNVWDRLKKK